MTEPASDPEKYSIDEMMDRLKDRESAETPPELVTRSDGSLAMRIKKRRRRTNQAVNKETKRNQRLQIIQISGFVILILFMGAVAGIGILYANSASFRDSLISKIEAGSGAKVKMSQFRMNPATANANSVNLEWPKGNVLQSLVVRSVVAKIAPVSFLGKIFKGEEITAGRGELVLQEATTGEVRTVSDNNGKLPVSFIRYSVPLLNVFFKEDKNPGEMLEKTEGSLFPSNVPGQAEIRLNGGLLRRTGWPLMNLDRGYMRVRKGELQVESLRLHIPPNQNQRGVDKGFINFSGNLNPLDSEATHSLTVELEAFKITHLIGADLGRFFSGNVETKEAPESNFLAFGKLQEDGTLLQMTIGNALDSRIDLSGFKFLSFLSLTIEDPWYELPNFENQTSVLVMRRGAKIEMQDINFIQRGQMALRGSLSAGGTGNISGNLRIGIPDTTIAAAPNKRLGIMFSEEREGYRWIDLKISGTSAAPVDNIMELFDAAAIPKAESGKAEGSGQDSFESLIESR
ncbi:MAG: hypothetical protein H7Y36_00145 [Armatimonadetes bacterium]|nr:hypothetical protein [Akkermansiaceae bacterium]